MMMKSATPTVQPSGLFHRMSGVWRRAGSSLPARKLTFVVLLLAAVAFGGVFVVAQAQEAEGAINGLTLSSDSPGTLTVSWDAASPAPGDYRVRWARSGESYPSWTSGSGNHYTEGTSVTLSGLEQGSVYKVQVRARYDDGDAPWSGSWASSSLRVSGRVSGDAQEEEATPTPGPTSAVAPTATPTPESTATPDPTPVPGAINGLTLSSDSPGTLTVSWDTPSPTPSDYRVRWAQAESDYPSWKDDNETDRGNEYPAGDATSLTLSGLSEETEFKVRVRARYNDGAHKDSPWSGPWTEGQAQVMSQPPKDSSASPTRDPETPISPAPAAPDIGGTAVTPEGHVLLAWLDPSDDSITGYQVRRGPDADNLVVIEEDTGSSGTSYTDTSPPAGRTHTYAVKARNAAGLSPPSDTVTATVPEAEEEEEEEELITAQQSEEQVLVSNLDSSANEFSFSAQGNSDTRRYAQTFSAANNADGTQATFDFDGVTFVLTGSSTGNLAASHLVVTVNSDNSGEPASSPLYTLTSATTSLSLHFSDRREFTFNAPADATLTSGVPYWLVFAAAPGSTYFDGNYIRIYLTSDDSEVQGTATVNHWSIGDTSRYNTASSTWQTEQRVMQVAILGAQRPPVLVSNLGQTDAAIAAISHSQAGAQAFVAGPGLAGFAYRFQGIRVSAAARIADGTIMKPLPPQVRASLHGDANGLPGPLLHTLTVPGDFASTLAFSEYTLSAPPDTVLRGGARYFVVFEVLNDILYLSTTSSPDEDEVTVPIDGWGIDDGRYTRGGSNPWVALPRVIKLAMLGSPEWDASEPAGEDFPGAYFNGHETTGVVTPGTVSTGHLTAGVDTDHGLTGDYWYLDTEPGHSYRVEVTFGDNPGISTGGFAGISFVDPDEVDYVSGCCESDHNREDGATFLHFKHQDTREWNTRYMVKVAAFDLYNTDTAVYNGPYEITLTDITGVYQMVTAFSGGTTRASTELLETGDGSSADFAMSFSTGAHAAGYTLDRIKVLFYDIREAGATPVISLNVHTASGPGDKLCDIAVPDRVVESQVSWSLTPPHTFLAPDCADDTLAANTTYWIVFSDANRSHYRVAFATSPTVSDYYGSGWSVIGNGKRGTSNTWVANNDALGRIGLWAKEFNNPLLVSLEVTSDPTKGTASDTYGAGDVITFEVKISEAVTVTGAPRLRFNIGSGSGDEYASYVSGSGSDTLVFAYTVLPTDADDNGIFLYNRSLSYPDAAADTIVAVDDNLPVIDNITGQRRTLSGHKVDGTITN